MNSRLQTASPQGYQTSALALVSAGLMIFIARLSVHCFSIVILAKASVASPLKRAQFSK